MGRGKSEIKRIENSTNRQVTFSKRRSGIIKKAKEISVLCEANIAIVIFSSLGKMSEFCSIGTTLPKMLEKYQQHSGKKLWDSNLQNLSAEIDRIKRENDNMQIELRRLKGEDLNSLNPWELIPIEDALQNGITSVRARQMEFLKMLKLNGKMLEEEHRKLTYLLHHQEWAMQGSRSGCHQRGAEYALELPLALGVQPIQPNLQLTK